MPPQASQPLDLNTLLEALRQLSLLRPALGSTPPLTGSPVQMAAALKKVVLRKLKALY